MRKRDKWAWFVGILAVLGLGLGLGIPAATASTAAKAGGYPTSSVSVAPVTTSPAAYPTTPTDYPTYPIPSTSTTAPPVVNPFARCAFSTTLAFTFDPNRHRIVERIVPAIVCDTGPWWRVQVQVYDLIGGSSR